MRVLEFLQICLLIVIAGCNTAPGPHKPGSQLPTSDCIEGITRQGFLSPSTSGDAPCMTGVQTCISRNWVGPVLFDYCDNFSKSCDGFPHGSSMTGFLQPSSPPGVLCIPATKTCINGIWTGPDVYPNCFQSP